MSRCIDWYLQDGSTRVIDLGASNVNGSYRELLPDTVEYVGFDLEAGPGVDIVLEDPYHIPQSDDSVDVVLSGQMLEHCAQFWRVFAEIDRVLAPGGLAFIIAPSAGPIHRYPVDCYRFYPDAYQALADVSGLRLVHCWLDERGPWRDLVGVFQKGGDLSEVAGPKQIPLEEPFAEVHLDPAAEATKGEVHYLDVLRTIHAVVEPALYVEIGVRKGMSLRLAECDAIAVDPYPDLEQKSDLVDLHQCTSDDFFFFHARDVLTRPVDLAFIDGMHLAEFVYRDFMNIERYMSADGVVVVDDVLPNHALQAERVRETRVWCGDVWRILPILQRLRPDLTLTLLDTAPSGLLIISGLNPSNRVLSNQYNPTVRQLLNDPADLPATVLSRELAASPTEQLLRAVCGR